MYLISLFGLVLCFRAQRPRWAGAWLLETLRGGSVLWELDAIGKSETFHYMKLPSPPSEDLEERGEMIAMCITEGETAGCMSAGGKPEKRC